MKQINVALVGCGTVGGSVARLLEYDKSYLLERNPVEINLKYLIDVDFTIAKELNLPEDKFCKDLNIALQDKDLNVVVELVGGTGVAKSITERALKAGKKVVTANKALLAHHGKELFALARANNTSIAFEASCGGGIPIIRALVDGLIANRIDAFYGIVNGTCNFILSSMTQRGMAYEMALQDAQEMGLAEADPTLDVGGGDSAHKLAIMAALAFSKAIDFNSLPVEGINTLDLIDVRNGEELGYVIKLLAIAQRRKDGVILCVRPAFISMEHPLAWVAGPFNAISVYGHSTGHTMYYGRGAGGEPTASAVVADIVQSGLGITQIQFENLNVWPDKNEPAIQMNVNEMHSRYYIRIKAEDKSGVIAQITDKFGKHHISISSVLQKEVPGFMMEMGTDGPMGGPMGMGHADDGVPVIITTHPVKEGNLKKALKEIDALDSIRGPSVCIQIVDEHPEFMDEELI